jgi:hypothetical protein
LGMALTTISAASEIPEA